MIWGCKFYFYCFFQAFTLQSKSCMCSRTRVAILLHFYSLILPDLHQQTKNHYFPWSLVGIFDSSPQRFFAFIRHHFRLNFRNKTLPVCCIRRKKKNVCVSDKKNTTHTQKKANHGSVLQAQQQVPLKKLIILVTSVRGVLWNYKCTEKFVAWI